jgi:hypothetical protein
MNTIKAGSVPTIRGYVTNSASGGTICNAFKLKENISFFINAVEEYGVPRHRLFQASDLVENLNFYRVLECLEDLATLFTAETEGTTLPPQKVLSQRNSMAPKSPIIPTQDSPSSTAQPEDNNAPRANPKTLEPKYSVINMSHVNWTDNQIQQAMEDLKYVNLKPRRYTISRVKRQSQALRSPIDTKTIEAMKKSEETSKNEEVPTKKEEVTKVVDSTKKTTEDNTKKVEENMKKEDTTQNTQNMKEIEAKKQKQLEKCRTDLINNVLTSM